MPDERRKAGRARIPGMRVLFEGAAGERTEAEVANVGKGGLFIGTAKPLAVGKRLSLEIQPAADVAAWSALGRVVWTRETGTTDAMPGMGVKLIDVDDAVVAAIDRLVDAQARAPSGTGASKVPSRERTVLGVGTGVPRPRPAPRERSVQEPPPEDWDIGDRSEAPTVETVVPHRIVTVGPTAQEAPPREAAPAEPAPANVTAVRDPVAAPRQPPSPMPEASIAIDLVARRPLPPAVRAADVPLSEASLAAAGVPTRRRGRWLVVLVVAVTVVGVYAERHRIPQVRSWLEVHVMAR
jgi:uncharacterized protein (TIGR02266 family)